MNTKQTILIVDSVPNNLITISNALSELKVKLEFSESSREAIKKTEEILPDLILINVSMPGISGFEICAALKKQIPLKNLVVILFSDTLNSNHIMNAFESGASDYISNLNNANEILSRVKNHLKVQQHFFNIQENNAKMKAAINSISDFIFYKDTASRYTGCNSAFSNFLKITPDEIIGKTDYDFYPVKKAESFINSDKYIIQTNKQNINEEWTEDLNGNKIFLNTLKTPIINQDGNTIGIVGISRNITAIKTAESDLKKNIEKLQNIYENANEGIFVLQNQKIVFFNNKLTAIGGYSGEEIINTNFIDFVHPDDRKQIIDLYNIKLRGQKIGKAVIIRIFNKEKEILFIKINSKQIIWENDFAILGMLDDVTQQILLEKELKASVERLRLSQKAGKIGTWEWNFKTDSIRCSETAFKIFGINKKEPFISSKDFFSYIHPEFKKQLLLEFEQKTKAKNNEYKTEYKILRGKQETKWVEGIFEIEYDEKEEQAVKMMGVLQDITDRKEAECQLKLKNEEIKRNQDEILAGIRYAETIQTSLLPVKSLTDKILKNYFIIYRPKDIVSGDFYSVNKFGDEILFSVADCTGHGVPGAFITILGQRTLETLLNETKQIIPSEILSTLRSRIKSIFYNTEHLKLIGIDIAMCSINTKTNILQYSGAFIPVWIVRNKEIIELKATRNPIGNYPVETNFINHSFQLQNNDKIYIFSDGFKDQIGGENEQKYNNKNFKKLILSTSCFNIEEQKTIIENELKNWMGNYNQIDDITIMCIEVKK